MTLNSAIPEPDLFLGKAYCAVGPARLGIDYFALERFRRGPAELPLCQAP